MRLKNSERVFLLAIILLLRTFSVHAQFDLMNQADTSDARFTLVDHDVDTTGAIPKFGPNRLFFAHGLGQIGEKPGPQSLGLQTNWWTGSIAYAARGKLKLWSWDALVMDFGYRYDRYSMRMNTPKLLPLDATKHERERISVHNLSGAICDRINFGRRGNVMGTWLDLGVYGDWGFRTTDVFVDQHYSSTSLFGYRFKSKTRETRLPYMEKMNYGLTARVGGDYVGIFAQWRMNNIIKSSYTINNIDLPKLTLGIEFYNWD